jgi:two-component system, OmpR family, phosphate regulon sensor histidine kinase PhoR
LDVIFISLSLAAWFAWRYFDLRRNVDQVTRYLRDTKNQLPNSKEIDELASVIESRRTTFTAEMTNLRNEKERLATVLEQLTDGVLIADADGRVQFANPAAGRLFDANNLINQTVPQVVRNHQLIEAWKRCQQTRQLQIESVELPTRKQFLQLIAIPDEHEGGSLLLAQDLTQVRKLETVRRDFISNVSHELRTPLASLKALTETLQSGALADPEAGPRFLSRIATEVDALTQMAQELLDLSRIESGQVQLNFESISPRTLLYAAADRMKTQAERANIKLNVLTADGLPTSARTRHGWSRCW